MSDGTFFLLPNYPGTTTPDGGRNYTSGNYTNSSDVVLLQGEEELEPEDYNWGVLFLFPVVVFGVAGNILVCMAVSMEKRLQSVTNYFLLSLAITDLLVCLIVWPFSIINEFLGYWPFNAFVCDLYITSDVLMCTSSILHLCTISLERYLAIRSPLSSRLRSKTKVRIKIALVWAASLAISSPITILGFIDEKNIVADNQCVLSNTDFILYGSVSAFFIPLGIMVIFFGFTIRLLRKQSRLCDPSHRKEGQVPMRRSTSRSAIGLPRPRFRQSDRKAARRTQSCPAPIQLFKNGGRHLKASSSMPLQETKALCTTPESPEYSDGGGAVNNAVQTIPIQEENEETSPLHAIPEGFDSQNNNRVLKDNNSTSVEMDCDSNVSNTSDNVTPIESVSELQSPKLPPSKSSRIQNIVKIQQSVLKSSAILLLKKDSVRQKQEKSNVKTEQKASKVLGVVFTIFVICWSPFFIVNVLTARCNECYFDHIMVTSFVWLGYVSSTLNPIIYTMFNRTFRTTFIKLLKCQYRTIQKTMKGIKHIPGTSVTGAMSVDSRDMFVQLPL